MRVDLNEQLKTFVTRESYALSNRTEWFVGLRFRAEEGRYVWLDGKPTGAPANSTFVAHMCVAYRRLQHSLTVEYSTVE